MSIVNPAQIRDFARSWGAKTDQVDAVHIREYAELFKPRPWIPPSPAMRRLCELQTIRAGTRYRGDSSIPKAGDRHDG